MSKKQQKTSHFTIKTHFPWSTRAQVRGGGSARPRYRFVLKGALAIGHRTLLQKKDKKIRKKHAILYPTKVEHLKKKENNKRPPKKEKKTQNPKKKERNDGIRNGHFCFICLF